MEDKFEVKDCLRMTSISCISQPQEHALMFMKNNDLRNFTDIINTIDVETASEEHWINQPINSDGETLLETAMGDRKKTFVETLVRSGVRIDMVSPSSGITPIHLAAQIGDVGLLRILLANRDEIDVNVRTENYKGSYTPLHIAAENGHIDCVKLLLDLDEIDVDAKDVRGVQTPLLLAVKGKHKDVIIALIENGACLDIKAGKLTIREYLNDGFPTLDPSKIRVKKSREVMLNLADKVFTLLRETELNDNDYRGKLGQFKTYLRFVRNLKEQNKLDNVFDLACKKGLYEHVELLLRKGANPNTASAPVLEAAFFGHYKIFKVLKRHKSTDFTVRKPGTNETILHLILKMKSTSSEKSDYQKCLNEVLDTSISHITLQMKRIVNKKDQCSNTALHYATQKWPQSTVRRLLEIGANIGMKNQWQEIPVSKIRPDTLENFLSEFCLSSKGDIVHEDFSITFKYDFLAPDIEALPEKYQQLELINSLEVEKQDLIEWKDTEDDNKVDKTKSRGVPLPETESLWYMSQSKEHRHLLKHPVITSFLWFKWQRIRKYFNRNLRFTLLFVFLLTWFVFRTTTTIKNTSNNGDSTWYFCFLVLSLGMFFFIIKDWIMEIKNYRECDTANENKKSGKFYIISKIIISNWTEAIFISLQVVLLVTGTSMMKYILAILLVLFVLREILQLTVSVKRYFASFENWVELGIMGLASYLLLTSGNDDKLELRKHLGAFTIILSWAEVIVLVGRHPKLKEYNIYVTMFLRVLKTFILFFTWYLMFVVSFGLGFFILLHKVEREEPAVGEGNIKKDDYPFFDKVWTSLVKTITMFTGELEFSDIPIDLNSKLAPLAYTFFLSFVFLIVVVLMNLLNGLAVSDTGRIREKAEIFSYKSQVETISTFESMLLGDPFDFLSNVPAILSDMPSFSLVRQLYRNRTLGKMFTKFGATEILLFYRFIPSRSVTIKPNKDSETCQCLRTDEMGRDIIVSAKEILLKNQKNDDQEIEDDDKSSLLTDLVQQYKQLQSQVQSLDKKMDLIIRKLN